MRRAGALEFLCRVTAAGLSLQGLGGVAAAADAPASTASEVVVTASRADLIGQAMTASEGRVTHEELDLRPSFRVGQLLETVPGLVVTVHSGEGKANQFLARGFNLDHGTDIANFLEDVPINRPTNAHGQGYSDLNFIVPELIGGLDYTKGPYHPQVGDFGAVASVHMRMVDAIPDQISLSTGTLGDDEAFVGGTEVIGPSDRVISALDISHVDGPFKHPDDFRKYAGVLRYSHGASDDGYSVTALYYHGNGNFTTDQPLRAVQEGLIGRYGTLDPTDGTHNERYSLSARYATTAGQLALSGNLYTVHSRQTLWNDFTHYLDDPVNGDQEQQDDDRSTFGGSQVIVINGVFSGIASRTTLGVQARYDDVLIDRRHTRDRVVLDYCEEEQATGPPSIYSVGEPACSRDRVQTVDLGMFIENATRFSSWFRTDMGLREEYYRGYDHSFLPGYDGTAKFDGAVSQMLLQPKVSLIFGPWTRTELYLSAGRGFHSDDVRGVTQTVPIQGIRVAAGPTPLLVRSDGAEFGLRSDALPLVKLQLAAFTTHLQSELIYDQDEGQDQASAPSERWGGELSAEYHAWRFLEFNVDLTASHARFVGPNLAAFGLEGNHIPNAPGFVGSLGVLVDDLGPWSGGLQVRALGNYPLTADNRYKDAGYTETNVELVYTFAPSIQLRAEAFNIFNTTANSSAYAYVTRLNGEPSSGVLDHQDHPLEPISGRLTATLYF